MHDILISRDSRGKIRVVDISYEWNDTTHSFLIIRKTSQWGGKVTNQPIIEVKRGKAQRTAAEQVKLEYNSNVKKYLDKGYKNIRDFKIESLDDIDDPGKLLGDITTDQSGAPKPMLAKSFDGVATSTFEHEFYGSTKIDGTRCLMHWNGSEVTTSSRGGNNYDVAANYIRKDPKVMKWLKEHPDMWLDGELYVHGLPLSYISGIVRLQTLDEKHKQLKYYVYDLAIPDVKFKDRLKILKDFEKAVSDSDKIVMVKHVKVSGWLNMKALHDQYVNDGWEGLVIRNPDKEYKFGTRDNRMIKLKMFEDHEYKILDLVDGLRDEDLCFLMETKEGYQFKAKPMGDRALKQWYRDHIEELKGQMGTVKHFGMTKTNTPVPNLPCFKTVRYSDDL